MSLLFLYFLIINLSMQSFEKITSLKTGPIIDGRFVNNGKDFLTIKHPPFNNYSQYFDIAHNSSQTSLTPINVGKIIVDEKISNQLMLISDTNPTQCLLGYARKIFEQEKIIYTSILAKRIFMNNGSIWLSGLLHDKLISQHRRIDQINKVLFSYDNAYDALITSIEGCDIVLSAHIDNKYTHIYINKEDQALKLSTNINTTTFINKIIWLCAESKKLIAVDEETAYAFVYTIHPITFDIQLSYSYDLHLFINREYLTSKKRMIDFLVLEDRFYCAQDNKLLCYHFNDSIPKIYTCKENIAFNQVMPITSFNNQVAITTEDGYTHILKLD